MSDICSGDDYLYLTTSVFISGDLFPLGLSQVIVRYQQHYYLKKD